METDPLFLWSLLEGTDPAESGLDRGVSAFEQCLARPGSFDVGHDAYPFQWLAIGGNVVGKRVLKSIPVRQNFDCRREGSTRRPDAEDPSRASDP